MPRTAKGAVLSGWELRAALLPDAWPKAPCPESAPFPHRDSNPVALAFEPVALSTTPQAENGRLSPLCLQYLFAHLQVTKKRRRNDEISSGQVCVTLV